MRSNSGNGFRKGVAHLVGHTFAARLHGISEWFMWFGGGILIILVFLITGHSTGRYFFKAPIEGAVEMAELAMVIIVYSAIAYVTSKEGNVSTTILVSRFPRSAQRLISAIMTLIGAGMFALLSWQLGLGAWDAALNGSITSVIRVPLFPFKIVAAIGAGIVCLDLLMTFLSLLNRPKKMGNR